MTFICGLVSIYTFYQDWNTTKCSTAEGMIIPGQGTICSDVLLGARRGKGVKEAVLFCCPVNIETLH